MAACMNTCILCIGVVFHCVRMCTLYSIYIECVSLCSAKGTVDVAFNKK